MTEALIALALFVVMSLVTKALIIAFIHGGDTPNKRARCHYVDSEETFPC